MDTCDITASEAHRSNYCKKKNSVTFGGDQVINYEIPTATSELYLRWKTKQPLKKVIDVRLSENNSDCVNLPIIKRTIQRRYRTKFGRAVIRLLKRSEIRSEMENIVGKTESMNIDDNISNISNISNDSEEQEVGIHPDSIIDLNTMKNLLKE